MGDDHNFIRTNISLIIITHDTDVINGMEITEQIRFDNGNAVICSDGTRQSGADIPCEIPQSNECNGND